MKFSVLIRYGSHERDVLVEATSPGGALKAARSQLHASDRELDRTLATYGYVVATTQVA